MKFIKRFYDEDFKNILMKQYNVLPNQITMHYEEVPINEDMDSATEIVFYIDIEEEGE